jgi:hypothetical protein
VRLWLSGVAVALWTALVLYPPALTELREPVVLLGAGSLMCMAGLVLTGRWAYAVAAACLWILEYGSALALGDEGDLAAPALGAVCWIALELVDWRALDARELKATMASSAVAGALGLMAAIVCVAAGLLVTGTVPLLVVAGAGIGALALGVVLTGRALGAENDLFVTALAWRRSQRKSR